MSFGNQFIYEHRIIDLLTDLKQNYGAVSLKAEFEDEGASFEETFLLKKFALQAGMDLTVKIGGCGALNDLQQVKKIGANPVAPMIESAYAFKKYIQMVNSVYANDVRPDIYVNIETFAGYQNVQKMLSLKEAQDLKGVVIGKCDMAKSMDLTCEDANSDSVFEIVKEISNIASAYEKDVIIGGGISPASIKTLKKLGENAFQQFETRKVIFDASCAFSNKSQDALVKAIEFEIVWLKNRYAVFGMDEKTYNERIHILEKRSEILLAK